MQEPTSTAAPGRASQMTPEAGTDSPQKKTNLHKKSRRNWGMPPASPPPNGLWVTLFANLSLCEIYAIYQGGPWAAFSLSIVTLIVILIAILVTNWPKNDE